MSKNKVRQIVWRLKPPDKSLYASLTIDAEYAEQLCELHQVVDGLVNATQSIATSYPMAWILSEGDLKVFRSPARYKALKDVLNGKSFADAMDGKYDTFWCSEDVEIEEDNLYPVEQYALLVSVEDCFWQIIGEADFQDYYESKFLCRQDLEGLLKKGLFA